MTEKHSDGDRAQTPEGGQDRLILRPQTAKILGTSVPSVRRLEKSGALVPILVDDKGVHWHSLRLVQEYAAQMTRPAAPAASVDGAVSAEAFELLDGGADAADLVKALEIPPADARELQAQVADLRGGMFLSGRAFGRIRRLPTADGTPMRTEGDFLRFLRDPYMPQCLSCRRPPVFCMVCFHNRPHRAQEAVAIARQRANERRARTQEDEDRSAAVEQARARSGRRAGTTGDDDRRATRVAPPGRSRTGER